MSLHPGGSTENTLSPLRSSLPGWALSAADGSQGKGGTQSYTACEKGAVLMSCSMTTTSVSVSRSPMGPRVLT